MQEYECSLSPETKTAARTELREDEKTREHALQQLRHWVLKHPTIKNCRTDAVFLLRFLRTKKFSVPLAQDMLERYLTIRQLYPNWFQNLDINDPAMEAIIDSGYLVPLPQKDRHGRQVILSCAGKHTIKLKFGLVESRQPEAFKRIIKLGFQVGSIRTSLHQRKWPGLTVWLSRR